MVAHAKNAVSQLRRKRNKQMSNNFNFRFHPGHVNELLQCGERSAESWFEAMNNMFPKYDIITEHRVAGFIAQTAHESNKYNALTENLNYSAAALDKIFGKYFKRAGRDAKQYHRQPEKIANVIYANRMDNGDTDSGDGWRFRGGGILQLTGRYNYTKFGNSVGLSALEATKYVRTKFGAIESACWFWESNDINRYCDNNDIVGMTKRINGGTIGLEDRIHHYEHALEILGAPVVENVTHRTLKMGMRGTDVSKMQRALGIHADGDFGTGTAKAVKRWQAQNGLTADGIVGRQTLLRLYN